MELKLTRYEFNGNFRGYGTYLCGATLRRKIVLPKNVKTIYGVFTKKSTEDSFTIVEPEAKYFGPSNSRIREWRGSLTYSTKATLARKYRQGYRYVHIEYDA